MHSTTIDDFNTPEFISTAPDLPCPSNTSATSSVSSPLPVHPLLNPLFADITLKATVNGSKYKNSKLDIKVVNIDGRLSLQHKVFKTWNTLDPAWVQPQHPHVSRDNSLLVVIEGEHVGQFVRQVDNVEIDGRMLMMLARIARAEETRDTLLPGFLYLPPSSLCVCSETDTSKKLNKGLIDGLREEARKGRL
ncbi:hypothetical protein CVT24_010726 [Panaeolus cyanescens]|uniref:C2 domain-containing protein n=1 Tax=Panaeolus cyanescens TaxID=181874 RepID=A0A409YM45_9AGAR|nr:hypothetical protein CVT24_010726 [Panaeolus cyanescens]